MSRKKTTPTRQRQSYTIELPRLHPAQHHIVTQAGRFNVICAGRRIGKTILGIDRLIQTALYGKPGAWMSPTYRMLTEVWRSVKASLLPLITRVSEQHHRIELITGGIVEMWSLEHADTIRGRKYQRVIIDEAAMVRDLAEAWQQVIRPTLTDMVGDAWLLSTPKGRGFFWECFQRGQTDTEHEWRCWQLPTSANPHIAPAEIEAMRRELPERVYMQEIEAQFLDSGGGVFQRVLEAATAEPLDVPLPDRSYVMGVDWARSGDYTCFIVLDTAGTMVYLDHFTDIAFDIQIGRLRKLYDRFQPLAILAEENSLGMPLVEQLAREGYPIRGMRTTNASKAAWIDALALAFEQQHIAILNHPRLIDELLAFERTTLSSGVPRYAAPKGAHDDLVMALAIAWQGCTKGGKLMLW